MLFRIFQYTICYFYCALRSSTRNKPRQTLMGFVNAGYDNLTHDITLFYLPKMLSYVNFSVNCLVLHTWSSQDHSTREPLHYRLIKTNWVYMCVVVVLHLDPFTQLPLCVFLSLIPTPLHPQPFTRSFLLSIVYMKIRPPASLSSGVQCSLPLHEVVCCLPTHCPQVCVCVYRERERDILRERYLKV